MVTRRGDGRKAPQTTQSTINIIVLKSINKLLLPFPSPFVLSNILQLLSRFFYFPFSLKLDFFFHSYKIKKDSFYVMFSRGPNWISRAGKKGKKWNLRFGFGFKEKKEKKKIFSKKKQRMKITIKPCHYLMMALKFTHLQHVRFTLLRWCSFVDWISIFSPLLASSKCCV